jgi:prepilin peptidase CpaA
MNLLFLLLWFAVCADQDARARRVSNELSLGAGLVALLYLLINGSSWLGAPTEQAWWALCLTLAMTLPGYALNKLGGGDVKLLLTLALASDSLHILGTFIGAGVTSVIWLMTRQKIAPYVGQRLTHRYPELFPHASDKQPFVPFLFLGFLITVACIH